MSTAVNRQTRKRLATRQKISDVASRLFIERGFDQVRIEEIAEAADVSRMTVFNHFPRKEDMFFDLDEEARGDLLAALEQKSPHTSPVEALRLFAHWAIVQQRPYVRFFEGGSDAFMATVQSSEALKSRARAIRDEVTDLVAAGLGSSIKSSTHDPIASLAASLLVATWTVALLETHREFQEHHDVARANAAFLALVDRGAKAVQSAVEGTQFSRGNPELARKQAGG